MKTIAICGTGGVGKTTITLYLAYTFTRLGQNVIIGDQDAYAGSGALEMYSNLFDITKELCPSKGYDIFIIDSHLYNNEVLNIADLIIIPFVPFKPETLQSFREDLRANLKQPYMILLNRVKKPSLFSLYLDENDFFSYSLGDFGRISLEKDTFLLSGETPNRLDKEFTEIAKIILNDK